jgi:two-component system response regulator HydG
MKDKKSLLIVDDDIAHRTMLRIILDWQYEIFEADDGATAVQKVSHRNFDLILMDMRMPGVSGIEALDRIKSLKPDLPVVMMTAYFSDDVAAQMRGRGASDCLGKPFDFDELKQTIAREMVNSQTA